MISSALTALLVSCLYCAAAVAQPADEPPKKADEKKADEKKTEKKDEPPGLTPDPKARAMTLANEGAKYAGNGQYKEAAAKYEESIRIHPIVDVFYNLGYVYEQMGQWKGCTDNYNQYLTRYRKGHNGADPAEIAGIKRSLEKCKESVQPPIEVTSEPPGARVALGAKNKLIGTTPLKQKIDPGSYQLFIMLDGHKTVQTAIVVQPRQPGKFHFTLQKVVNTGKVQVVVNVRDATIYIDGKNFGLSPYRETPSLEVGKHQVVVKKDRYNTVNQTFDVQRGRTTELKFDLHLDDPPPSWKSYLGWAAVSIGAVSIAGGVVAYKFADEKFNDTDDFDQLLLFQNLGYGLGGGLMGVGTILLIWEAFSDAVDSKDIIDVALEPPLQLGVTPTDGGAYFSGSVRF